MLADGDFMKACEELEKPNVGDYEFFTESQNVTIYRQYDEETSLYKYKVYGELKDVPADICAKVYMDLKYRKAWDEYAKELEKVKSAGDDMVYWEINFPFPLSNRDYVFRRQMREFDIRGKRYWVVLAEAVDNGCVPVKPGVVRVTEYLQQVAMTSNGCGGTKAFMEYFDNPGGFIPTWLINWAASKGVPNFLTEMHNACTGYPSYLKSLKKPSTASFQCN